MESLQQTQQAADLTILQKQIEELDETVGYLRNSNDELEERVRRLEREVL